jgi:hypothetical protein
LTRWGYGGRWWSCDGEEGGEGEIDAPRKRNGERKARATLTMDETRDGGRAASDSGDGAFNALERHGAWQPRGNGALPGRPGADSGV